LVNKLILSNLLHRPIRTAVSMLAVAIEVGMVMLVVGLTHGMLNDSAKRVEGVGADVLVQPPGSSFLLAFGSAPVPVKVGDRLAERPHVQAVAPVLTAFNSANLSLIFGINMDSFDKVTGGFVYHSGGPLKSPTDVLVDDVYAKAHQVKVGDKVDLLAHRFYVAGIVEHGKGSRLFIPMATAEDLLGVEDKASIFFVKCTDPGYADDVIANFKKFLPTYDVKSIKDYMSLMTSNNLPAMDTFNGVMVGLAAVIGFMVIFLSMYTTITERTREIGILKSLGASKGYIIAVILREASVLAAVGILAGYVGATASQRALRVVFPSLTIQLTVSWAFYAGLLAVAGSLLGAFYPAFRAAQLDPVDALAYE